MLAGWGFEPNSAWHWGFGAAGVGMTLGLVQYVLGSRHLGEAGLHPAPAASPREAASLKRAATIWLGGGMLVLVALAIAIATGVLPVTRGAGDGRLRVRPARRHGRASSAGCSFPARGRRWSASGCTSSASSSSPPRSSGRSSSRRGRRSISLPTAARATSSWATSSPAAGGSRSTPCSFSRWRRFSRGSG